MPKQSAGILLWRRGDTSIEVLLVHPGGPFFARKDAGVWSIPKGEYAEGEDPLVTAKREFAEEVGCPAPAGTYEVLAPVTQRGGKLVRAFAIEGNCSPVSGRSNTFKMEWPPRSGRQQEFPEVDRAEWFPISVAREKLNVTQAALLDELTAQIAVSPCPVGTADNIEVKIDAAVDRVVREYGETLRLLGKE